MNFRFQAAVAFLLALIITAQSAGAQTCVDNTALATYITQWKTDSAVFTMPMLMQKISDWKSGAGCTLGEELFVSVSGSGSRNGLSAENSFNLQEALQYANANLSKEIIFLLAQGNYGKLEISNGKSRTAWVTLKAQDTANRAVFEALDLEYTPNAFMAFEGIVFHYQNVSTTTRPVRIYDTISGTKHPSQIKFVNCEIAGVPEKDSPKHSYTFEISRGENITISNCEIYGGVDVIEIRGSANILIENSKIHDSGRDGLAMQDSSNATVKNNQVYNIDLLNLYEHRDAISIYGSNDVLVQGNTIYNVHGQGIYLSYSSTVPICKNVTIEKNVMYGFVTSGMLKLQQTEGLIVRSNTILGTGGPPGTEGGASSVTSGCSSVQFYNNIIRGTYSLFSPASSTTEYNNIFENYGSTSTVQLSQKSISLQDKGLFIKDVGFANYDANDFRPLMSGIACNGIVNAPNVEVGALPCTG